MNIPIPYMIRFSKSLFALVTNLEVCNETNALNLTFQDFVNRLSSKEGNKSVKNGGTTNRFAYMCSSSARSSFQSTGE